MLASKIAEPKGETPKTESPCIKCNRYWYAGRGTDCSISCGLLVEFKRQKARNETTK